MPFRLPEDKENLVVAAVVIAALVFFVVVVLYHLRVSVGAAG